MSGRIRHADLSAHRAILKRERDQRQHVFIDEYHKDAVLWNRVIGVDEGDMPWSVDQMLMTGIAMDDAEQVAAALRLGANPNSRSFPLHKAVFCEFEDAVGLLINAGANVNLRDERKRTALHFAANCHPRSCRGIIVKLVAAGAKLDAKDDLGMTPLENALEAKNQEAEATLRSINSGAVKVMRSWRKRVAERETNDPHERKRK